MNRLLATAITQASPTGRRDAVLPTQGQGSKLAGLPASVAYCHDFGRESDEATPSGEGHG